MLWIYVPRLTPRITYIFQIVFEIHFGIEYQILTDIQQFDNAPNPKLNYSDSPLENSFFIRSHSLLLEDIIEKPDIAICNENDELYFFSQENTDFKFDVFAAALFLLTRYEEYLPFQPDQFGRFPAHQSLASQHAFLTLPLVDIWLRKLKVELQKRFPTLVFSNRKFTSIFTYDIDVAFKYIGRPWTRILGATFRHLMKTEFKEIKEQWEILLGLKKDPWDIYDSLLTQLKTNEIKSIFFFPAGKESVHDRNLNINVKPLQRIIHKIKNDAQIGLHPSFQANRSERLMQKELSDLERVSQQKITKSRQHFLKLSFPETYRRLIEMGIKEDYTMAYPDAIGFRASTSVPYPFFDLKNNKKTELIIYPAVCMDATFIYYLKSTCIDAFAQIQQLIDHVKSVDGSFISIWHNNYLEKSDDTFTWYDCHQKVIEYLRNTKTSSENIE